MKNVLRSASSLVLLLSLAACAPLSLDFLRPQAQGLDTMTQKVGPEAPELAFSFEFDDKADALLNQRLTGTFNGDANDHLYQWDSSRDYNPSPGLERITASGLGRLLQSAYRSPLMPELMASLPVSGLDGTLRRVAGDPPAWAELPPPAKGLLRLMMHKRGGARRPRDPG